ncbi:hypothetical protein [Methylobacterium brachythecii]|uniref:Uncharacterized protein n=1 Tax=Methylobacterium brachythecii TaxID=1176177 RepID=A0A7W6AQU9_9HYPH|nr:hypothetical protein [Methylobacterium brachythecii]MBB3905669.1 hypothetical protein [Methylobacterium brachythecii]GLS46931.1 hypothetical protein GCM10007884_49310 [Methylobacterium brachythecii]
MFARWFGVLALCLTAGSALARDNAAVPVGKLIATPKAYVGELVVVRGIACVDPGTTGFLCEASSGGRKLRIDALLLGAQTALPIAERLLGGCKGTAALNKTQCRVDIVVTPTSADSSDESTVTILAREIEMYAPRKIR